LHLHDVEPRDPSGIVSKHDAAEREQRKQLASALRRARFPRASS
jgi:hypothetical protein